MESINKIVIPEGVVDEREYKRYYIYSQSSIIKNKFYEASDGEDIDLGMFPHLLKKLIEKYPPKEQEIILDLKRRRSQAIARMNGAKGRAYGKGGRRNHEKPKPNPVEVLEADIVELLGRLFSVNEVVRIVGEDNGIQITEQDVKNILKKNLTEVERKREAFRNRAADVRLYNKRPRLEELTWMYGKMKMRYISFGGEGAYNAMLRTLEQLRKEAEGDILNVQGAIDVNLNIELNAHVQKEILKTINIKEIILGRVAARMGYDCKKLVAGLHNSYYNQFVQISGDYNEDAEMSYPSLINYDFGEIEKRNAEIDDIVDIKPEPLSDTQQEKAKSIKELFLSKIRAQREEAEQRSSSSVVDVPSYEVKEDYPNKPKKHEGSGKNVDAVLPSKTKGQYGKL